MQSTYPSPETARPPPDVPNDPKISEALTRYLRTFALWCRSGFADRLPNQAALPGVLLQSPDAPAGTAPAVWLITVPQTGVNAGKLMVTRQTLGTGYP